MFPQLEHPIPFDQLAEELASVFREGARRTGTRTPPFGVALDEALTEEHRRNPRRYAAVTAHAPEPTFYFAEQTLWLPAPHRLGLYAHEVGHVLDPDPRKTEEGADLAGMAALDLLIVYDLRWPGKGLQVGVR